MGPRAFCHLIFFSYGLPKIRGPGVLIGPDNSFFRLVFRKVWFGSVGSCATHLLEISVF